MTQENTITLVDNMNSNIKCEVKFSVRIEKYDNGNEYYYISYDILNGKINSAHPFYNNNSLMEHSEGDIVFKNDITEKIIEYMLLNDEDLSKYTGSTTSNFYRKNLMKTIAMFYD
jgi:hypothetical protein